MEALMNINASKGTARGAVAAFLGYCWVEPRDAAGELTPGLWLVCDGLRRGMCECLHHGQPSWRADWLVSGHVDGAVGDLTQ
jgi:hypothetical protein